MDTVEQLKQQSDYYGAIRVLSELLHQEKKPHLIIEMIRLLLLSDNPDLAFSFFQILGDLSDHEILIPEELELRFNIYTNFQYRVSQAISSKPSGYAWVQSYRKNRSDPFYLVEVCKCEVKCHGFINYRLTLVCPCCQKHYKHTVMGSLLIKKKLLCPHCLARQMLAFEKIRAFICRRHHDLIGDGAVSLDRQVVEIKNSISPDNLNPEISPLVYSLGQDIIFAITQMSTEHKTNV